MPRHAPIALLAMIAGLAPAAPAGAEYRPDEVIVGYAPGTSAAHQRAVQRAAGTRAAQSAGPAARVLRITDGGTVRQTARELERQPGVRYAVPNHLARGSGVGYFPNDHGLGPPGAWQRVQWNFLAGTGIDAPGAWAWMLRARAPGGRGVTVAVLDTGVAYRFAGRYRRSPDFSPQTFVPGYDFVSRDPYPDDPNGHGTLIAGIVAERTNNLLGVTGIAYGARVMPIRVLDAQGLGDAATIAAGIRFAARRDARVINLSLEFDSSVPSSEIPEVLRATAYARSRGAVVVGAAGNTAQPTIAYPGRARGVISVGATTEHVCVADYSNHGPELDLVAPGGGADARLPDDPVHCRPDQPAGRSIFQLTYKGGVRRFGLPDGYEGTSMAAPHVSAVAALVIASGVIGKRPSPSAVETRLKRTARDLGPPGRDVRYGAGMVNAGAAVTPAASRVR
jgi:serine protease